MRTDSGAEGHSSRVPRTGIERKILTSILWVGIVPLALAFVVALIATREEQSSAARHALLTAARTTSAGLRLACFERQRGVTRIAGHPMTIQALETDNNGVPALVGDEDLRVRMAERLADETGFETNEEVVPSVFRLYGAYGTLLMGEEPEPIWESNTTLWPAFIQQPLFLDINYAQDPGRYLILSVAPVYATGEDGTTGEDGIIGFVSEVFDATKLVQFALGEDPHGDAEPSGMVYQFLFEDSAGTMRAGHLADPTDPTDPVFSGFVTPDLDSRLAARLTAPDAKPSGSAEFYNYDLAGQPEHVLIAYDQLFDYAKVYIAVSRPARMVFSRIYQGVALALVVLVLGIAFLYLNAYRHVHNNIVRPVLLLNEGAQIIGQGDLELKLKIHTGDEIEELAQSFNKMALALKANIRQLGESEERYRSVVTSMRDGIGQASVDGVIEFINPAGLEIFGYESADELLGANLKGLYKDEADFLQLLTKLLEQGYLEHESVVMLRRNGQVICIEISGNLVRDDDGEVVGLEGTFRDVTESVRLERAAREHAERISAISQIANVINSSLEAGRLYDSLVVEVKKLVNFDYAEISLLDESGTAFQSRRLWPEQGLLDPVIMLDDEQNCAAWVTRNQDCLLVNDLSAERWTFAEDLPEDARSCLCVPLYASGRIIGTLNVAANRIAALTDHDVEALQQIAPHIAVAMRNAQLLENLQASLEEVTRAHERLHEANEELKTLDEMKTNLLSNVSHELRTPLVAVMGYTDMIYNEKAGPVTDAQREYLAISLRSIERLVTLIENLLDFSRLHRGAETLSFDTFNLSECAGACLRVVKPLADSREISLHFEAPEGEILVEGDRAKLDQVFNNLLSNAIKFNHTGGSVTLRLTPSEDAIETIVSDTGIGIPEEALDKVFTRFYQYDSSSTRKYGGTGIGLSIAQDIVRLHGGRITVTSEAGKGASFRFSLPVRVAKTSGDEEPGDFEGTHLLVGLLTNDRLLSNQVRNLLEPEGMDVLHASTPSRAIELARRHHPDCLLLDAEAGDESDKLIESLLADANTRDTPLVVLTNDDKFYARHRTRVASRVRRGFRKSTLLSSIRYALHQQHDDTHPFGHSILCVDDDPEVLTFMMRCLEDGGYAVNTCDSGDQAIREAATRDYGLILLDIAMPGVSGWEVCRKIKGDPTLSGIKIAMVTAKYINSSMTRPQDSGADGFLTKPFKAQELLELVQGFGILCPASEVR